MKITNIATHTILSGGYVFNLLLFTLVKAVNEQNHNSMSCMSAWRANGHLVLPYSGSRTLQMMTSSISIIIRSDVS